MLQAVTDGPERRTALQARCREVHGSHGLLEPMYLVGLSESVEVGDAGERASGPSWSLELRFGAAE